MNKQPVLFAFLFMAAFATGLATHPAHAQTADHGKITTVSRSVKVFSQLEQSLDAAIAGKDQASVDKLLAADFELRSAANPSVPVARDEWLQNRTPATDAGTSQMAVHDHGTLAVASYLRSTPSDQPDQPAQLTFVVDVWKKQGENWQLATRYESDAGTASAPEQDVAPSGKG